MTWTQSYLVVANVTATTDQFIDALKDKADGQPAKFYLVVPSTPTGGGWQAAREKLSEALERLREAGLEADGSVGNDDPLIAVREVWDPRRFDEIIVSTLPMRFSKWLHGGLPERISKLTGAQVTHIVSEEKHPVETSPPPPHDDPSEGLGPLNVLGWGGHREH